MARKVFINLPVKNLERSVSFFTKLGFSFDPQFTDDKATCMIIEEGSFVMLITESFFQTFIEKQICDAKVATEVIISLDTNSREEVQQLVAKAEKLGGTVYKEPQDYGWMYQHGFGDLDGHQWEIIYMDISKFPNQSKK